MLIENTLFGVVDKVQIAIDRLKAHEPEEGYYLAFSGGKDSMVILGLALMSEVKFEVHNNHTTVDPPELVYFIRDVKKWLKEEYNKDLEIHYPEKTMWELIVENGMPPLRQMRYCCRILKERGGEGRFVITGVRAAESHKRAGRRMVEYCGLSGSTKMYINPIIDWEDDEVWEFIKKYKIPYCSLYKEGWKRLGCVCCPNSNQKKQAKRWPKIAEGYKQACIRAFEKAKTDGKTRTWKNGKEMFKWWISGKGSDKGNPDQTVMFE